MNNPKVLVIGSGGGRDVVAALAAGSTDVTAVEINPITFQTVMSYGARAGNVYTHEHVRAFNDEGRSFVTRSTEKYDMIYIPFVDTWASVSSGGLSVSENFLYTSEAFQQYYDHLTERGQIVSVRWLIDTPRFVSTYVKLLEAQGIPQTDVYKHLIVVTASSYRTDPSVTMVVFSKAGFTASEITSYSDASKQDGYMPILIPGEVAKQPYSDLLVGKTNLDQFYSNFQTKAYPVSDDSPYFLSYEKPIPTIVQNLIAPTLVIVATFLVLPLVWLWRQVRNQSPTNGGISLASTVPYFSAIGMGFILLELGLLQKLTLLLGNPTTTFAILLFTLLVAGGLGSLASGRLIRDKPKILFIAIGGIIGIGLLYTIGLPSLIYTVLPDPFYVKAIVSIAILVPIGFLMGMPLPSVMRLMKLYNPVYIPWMWAINGAFSVLGSILAVILAIMYGASFGMMLGIATYLIAFATAMRWQSKTVVDIHARDPSPSSKRT